MRNSTCKKNIKRSLQLEAEDPAENEPINKKKLSDFIIKIQDVKQAEVATAIKLFGHPDTKALWAICSRSGIEASMARNLLHLAQIDERYRCLNSYDYRVARYFLLRRLGLLEREFDVSTE